MSSAKTLLIASVLSFGRAGWWLLGLMCVLNVGAVFNLMRQVPEHKNFENQRLVLQQREAQNKKEQTFSNQQLSMQRMRAHVRALPQKDSLPAVLAVLESQARHHTVQVKQGHFEPASQTEGGMNHAALSLEVLGNYASVLAFVAQALNEENGLALTDLAFKRTDPLVSELQIALAFEVWLNADQQNQSGIDRVENPLKPETPHQTLVWRAPWMPSGADVFAQNDLKTMVVAPAEPAPPPVMAVAAPPQESGPPPLPFVLMGRFTKAGQSVLFLKTSKGPVPLVQGEQLENGQYTVEAVRDTQALIRYLPTGYLHELNLEGVE